jgi:hypothetical protein
LLTEIKRKIYADWSIFLIVELVSSQKSGVTWNISKL